MDDPKISVTLTGPAKIAGKHEPPGKTVTVSHTLALQLAASSAIDPAVLQQLAAAISKGDDEITFSLEQRLAEMKEEVEARVRDEIGDEYAAALAENERLKESLSKAGREVAELSVRFTDEASARVKAEKQLAAADNRIAELEEIITSRGVAAEEATEEATNTQKAGKKPTAAKD